MYYSRIMHALLMHLKILKMGLTILFTYLKIILLQCFQFSNNKFNPNGPIVSIIMKKKYCVFTLIVKSNAKNTMKFTIYLYKLMYR